MIIRENDGADQSLRTKEKADKTPRLKRGVFYAGLLPTLQGTARAGKIPAFPR
jgi:hypothetical protein